MRKRCSDWSLVCVNLLIIGCEEQSEGIPKPALMALDIFIKICDHIFDIYHHSKFNLHFSFLSFISIFHDFFWSNRYNLLSTKHFFYQYSALCFSRNYEILLLYHKTAVCSQLNLKGELLKNK